jgi:uncharacterized SAM-binding protein YcdF (DUF218 family)
VKALARRRTRAVSRLAGLATLGLLALAAFTPLANVVARRLLTPDPPAPADAIVALASTVYQDGTLSDASLRRFARAVELYAAGAAPILVLSGSTPEPGLDEAAVRATLARRFGVPPAAILPVPGSRTTREEARAVAALLGPRGARRVLVVTDWPHATRTRATFSQAGLDARIAVTGRPADAARSPANRLWLAWECARELGARAYYRLGFP